MDEYDYGYPFKCKLCTNLFYNCSSLTTKPYLIENGNTRLMLIGQDPNIHNGRGVNRVLDLDNENGQVRRWLINVFGESIFDTFTLYATNLVKCTLEQPPSESSNVLKLLQTYFRYCQTYLLREISLFKPNFVLSFGETAHELFYKILSDSGDLTSTMRKDFTGTFSKVRVGEISFLYSPCLHIRTFKIADAYGDKIKEFKINIKRYFHSPN
jgi:uracil-DNA glycosylase family 4